MILTFFDTRDPFDAYGFGLDGARDPAEDAEGLIVTLDPSHELPTVSINGPNGEIELVGAAQVKQLRAALQEIERTLSYKGAAGLLEATASSEF